MNSKKNHYAALCFTICLTVATGCSDKEEAYTLTEGDLSIEVPAGGFKVSRCKTLRINPTVINEKDYAYQWAIGDSVLSAQKGLDFIALTAGSYELTINVSGRNTVITKNINIEVMQEQAAYSPYITSIYDFRPAPGQFTNELPLYEDGDTQQSMNNKALEAIGHNKRGMISLGSYGGYVICGFDHTILNIPGQNDFKVLGNAFYADANPNPNGSVKGGSCEPGIVMVAYDKNQNGKPDEDEWYELAGSEYHKTNTIKNYEIVYNRPSADHVATPDNENAWNIDSTYISWKDNQGKKGYVYKNSFHDQDYYPKWIKEDMLTYQGTLLAGNAIDESGTGSYWVLYAYDWGYADNGLNNNDDSNMDIDWAVDKNGNPVRLPGIDFIKIYTGVNQYCGWLGETSTEVLGINDLHLLGINSKPINH